MHMFVCMHAYRIKQQVFAPCRKSEEHKLSCLLAVLLWCKAKAMCTPHALPPDRSFQRLILKSWQLDMPGFLTKKGAWQNWLTDRTAAVGLYYSLPGQPCNSKEWNESSKQVQSQEKVWATSPPLQAEGWQDYSMYKEGYRVERQKNWACAEAFGSEEHK